MMCNLFKKVCLLLLILFLTTLPEAQAAKKGAKKPNKKGGVDISKVSSATVTIKKGKKTVSKEIFCFNKTPGVFKMKKKKASFKSFKSKLSKMTPGTKKHSDLKKLNSAAAKVCRAGGTTPVPGNPTPTPDYLSLDRYNGPFTADLAKVLYDRFGYGGTQTEIDYAVSLGLVGAVNHMTSYEYNQDLEAKVGDLNCDGELESEGDSNNRSCNADGVYLPGVRYGLYYRALHSTRPFFEKMFFFLHDERMATSADFLDSHDLHVVIPHVNMLRRAAISGDYVQFMRDWNRDDLGHRLWLDGGVNNGFAPNENYAREFWELGTVGPSFLDGSPVYSDADIAESARAFSGIWNAFHSVGTKTIFQGTPWQAYVDDYEGVLQATFNHPRTAEHLAEDLWKEFINPYATNEAIQRLAQIIRDNNYNLIPVMQTIMTSKAVFANESQKTLIKHPVDLILGLMRSTGIYANYGTIDSALAKMGERPLLAPTVFGWHVDALAGEPNVFDWRNAVGQVLSDSGMQERKGFTLADLATIDDPSLPRSTVTLERIASSMNLYLGGSAAATRLNEYLDYDLAQCNGSDMNKYDCSIAAEGRNYRIVKKDLAPTNTTKIKNLMIILATLPDYRLK